MSEIYKKLPTDIQEVIDKQLLSERNYNDELELDLLPTLLYNKIFNELPHKYNSKDAFSKEDFTLIKWFCYEVFTTRKYGEWNYNMRRYIWNVSLGVNDNPLIFWILKYMNNDYDTTETELPDDMEDAIRCAINNYIYEEINDTEDMNNFCKKLNLNVWEMIELFVDTYDNINSSDYFKGVICYYLVQNINGLFLTSHRIRNIWDI